MLETSQGSVSVSERCVNAIVRNASLQADLVVAALMATGLYSSPSEIRLPCGFLLEFGAVLQLGFWERKGLLEHLGPDLPSYNDAVADLAARAQKGPEEFDNIKGNSFSSRITRIAVERLAWDANSVVDADVVVIAPTDEEVIDRLAEFLWSHRHLVPV